MIKIMGILKNCASVCKWDFVSINSSTGIANYNPLELVPIFC